MNRTFPGILAAAFALPAGAAPAPAPAPSPHPRQAEIDKAIDKGAACLKKRIDKGVRELGYDWVSDKQGGRAGERCLELVLYALHAAGVGPADDKDYAAALEKVLEKRLHRTYETALQAILLEALDREEHQVRIAECAQYLLDNQCENGQWSYGEDAGPAPVKSKAGETKAVRRIALTPRKKGPKTGDDSNTQYALLGLRSCVMAGCVFPPDTLDRADKAWGELQNPDGGWDYGSPEAPRGKSNGGMTAGGLGSLCITQFLLNRPAEKDPRVQKALAWLDREFTVKTNPQSANDGWHYYYLYALERAGMLAKTESIGKHGWYDEGVEFLLKAQHDDGSWSGLDREPIVDTCYAILFLRRATKALAKVVYTTK